MTWQEKSGDTNHQEVFGHRLVKQPRQRQTSGTPPTCEGCRKQVRGLIRVWYLCKSESLSLSHTHTHTHTHTYTACGCACHKGCMSKVTRRCNQFNKIKVSLYILLSSNKLTCSNLSTYLVKI